MSLYPLKFVPRFVEKIWGGRKIETVLGKKLPPGKHIGESWEIYDFPPGVVDSFGGAGEQSDRQWPACRPAAALGGEGVRRGFAWNVPPVGRIGQFPLLIKFLDAREDLSVQVHPDEQYAAQQSARPTSRPKPGTSCNMIPAARLFKGLRPGTTTEAFVAAIDAGTVEQHLGTIPREGANAIIFPAARSMRWDAGILVAEVQTPSDTTFRVFDFNRVDPSTGKHRTLHVEQAMQCIDFAEHPQEPAPNDLRAGWRNSPWWNRPISRSSEPARPASATPRSSAAIPSSGSCWRETPRSKSMA